MDMTPAYFMQLAAALGKAGFAHAKLPLDLGLVDGVPCPATQHRLTKDETSLVLEHVAHPSSGDMYYLEIAQHVGLRLHSWKIWPDRIEFKFYESEDGRSGLALTFALTE
jgi:hypothetical protein